MRSMLSVGDTVGLFDIVDDHVGSDEGRYEILGLNDGSIDEDGNHDMLVLGSLEGMREEDGASEGVIDSGDDDGCMLGSFD